MGLGLRASSIQIQAVAGDIFAAKQRLGIQQSYIGESYWWLSA